jgi:hypothetical protein
MSKYRFVHLSDIHFGQERNGTIVTHDDVRAQLIRDCSRLKSTIGPADGIIVTGDVAYSGLRKEYERAGEWLDELAAAVGCDIRAVNVVPGNHDVDTKKIAYLGEVIHERLKGARPEELDGILEKVAASDEALNPLMPKFAAYREFASRYDCDFESAAKPSWYKTYPLRAPNFMRFEGLNSAQVSDLGDQIGRMVLGNTQYVLPELDNCEYVVMMHHPPVWLKDRRKAEQYLGRARIIMVGHEHDLKIQKLITDNGSEHLLIFAGATNPDNVHGAYQFRYNWIEFELTPEPPGTALSVTIWPRVWSQDPPRFIPDQARLNGAELVNFSLACDHFGACEVSVPSGGLDSTELEPVQASPIATESARSSLPMAQEETDSLARLRYYFWKYLDWHKRLEVLVHIDILPTTLNQPVPQTMERIALETAQRQGKLADLWNAVMDHVPDEKREANPFVKKGDQ